jgi:serine/threonine protein phosphatase PrpC
VALIVEKELFVANAGDSRAVLCRGGRAIALTEDHKPFQDREMERIRKAGGFVTEQGRVNGNLNLSRSIGDLKYKGEKTTREDEESRAGNFPFPLLFSSTSMTTQLFVSRFQARPCSWEAWH